MATTKRTTGLLGQPTLLRFGLFEITFFVAYRFGMSFTQSLASPLWFPDAVLLCVLLGSRSGVWWIYILGTLPIRLFLVVPADTPFWFLVACFVNDSLKALLSAWLLGRITRHGSWFDDLGQFARYFLVAVIVSPGLSAVAGATSRIYRGDEFGGAWIHWFLGDALAALILTPFLVSLSVE
ncbi:MAG TPA: MASE1 domain-containing protein, partial [Terriglobia bacterium]|nr:MASE1 domain-containing protein [Terriglobia bacterium]